MTDYNLSKLIVGLTKELTDVPILLRLVKKLVIPQLIRHHPPSVGKEILEKLIKTEGGYDPSLLRVDSESQTNYAEKNRSLQEYTNTKLMNKLSEELANIPVLSILMQQLIIPLSIRMESGKAILENLIKQEEQKPEVIQISFRRTRQHGGQHVNESNTGDGWENSKLMRKLADELIDAPILLKLNQQLIIPQINNYDDGWKMFNILMDEEELPFINWELDGMNIRLTVFKTGTTSDAVEPTNDSSGWNEDKTTENTAHANIIEMGGKTHLLVLRGTKFRYDYSGRSWSIMSVAKLVQSKIVTIRLEQPMISPDEFQTYGNRRPPIEIPGHYFVSTKGIVNDKKFVANGGIAYSEKKGGDFHVTKGTIFNKKIDKDGKGIWEVEWQKDFTRAGLVYGTDFELGKPCTNTFSPNYDLYLRKRLEKKIEVFSSINVELIELLKQKLLN